MHLSLFMTVLGVIYTFCRPFVCQSKVVTATIIPGQISYLTNNVYSNSEYQ